MKILMLHRFCLNILVMVLVQVIVMVNVMVMVMVLVTDAHSETKNLISPWSSKAIRKSEV